MSDPSVPADIEEQAVAWLVRTADPAFLDWEDFSHWLATSPEHADAYHRASAADAEMVELLASAPTEPMLAGPSRHRWHPPLWLGGLIAASLLLAVVYESVRPVARVIYQTGPGQRREVALADGTHMMLNGNTRLSFTATDARTVSLEQGEALFAVRHDPNHPFAITVAGATITDVGTVFDVVRDERDIRVAVAQGVVSWNPAGENIRLDAGRALRTLDGGATLSLEAADTAAVGAWSRGELSYDGAPLGTVATDVTRALGVSVVVSPDIASRPVRGVILLEGGASAVVPRIANLLDVRARREGSGWRLSATP